MSPSARILIMAPVIILALIIYSAAPVHGAEKKISQELKEKSLSLPGSHARVIIKLKSAPDKIMPSGSPVNARISFPRQKTALDSDKISEKQQLGNNLMAAEIPLSELDALAADNNVEYIEEDLPVHAFLSQSVPLIGANSVWTKQIAGENITGAGTSVCIIDTGIDYTHPDLGECNSTTFLAGNCQKVIAGYDFVNNDNNPMDDNGHGTHVAGTVAANGALKGVAPDAKIVAIKVLDSGGSGSESDVLAGIDWCVSNSTKYNISAISMSLGADIVYSSYCDSEEPSFRDAINEAAEKNISVVVATGNSGSQTGYSGISLPACIENATRATATDKSDNYASFANRGINFPDILAAPGVSITSTYLGGGYASLSGTSMATPHVSGAIALLSQAYSKIYGTSQTPQYFKNLLNSTGKRINDTSGAKILFSRINVSAAYGSLTANPITIAQPVNGTFTNQNFSDIFASQRIPGIMWFSADELQNNSVCSSCVSFINSTGNLTEGIHNITVYGNNSAETLNYTISYFTIDTTSPAIAFENPTDANNSYADRNWIFANLSVNETNFENATIYLFNSSGSINSTSNTNASGLNINWTNLAEGIYFFNATAYDRAGNFNSTETRKVTVDLMPPTITNINIFPATMNTGQNVTIAYSITDISPIESNVSITHNNISESANVSFADGNYTAVFSNTTDAGEYNITIYAKDAVNQTSNASARFFANATALLSLNSTGNSSITLLIMRENTTVGSMSVAALENKNEHFDSNNYTIEAHGENETFAIILSGVEFAPNEELRMFFSDTDATTPDQSKYRFTNNSFAFSPDFNRSSATVCFNYTAYANGFQNISRAKNFKCEGLCADVNWSVLQTAIDTSTNQSCSNVSSFSSFVLGETLPYCGDGNIDAKETCRNCPADAGACPASQTTASGGWYSEIMAIKPKNIANATESLTALKCETALQKNLTGQDKTCAGINASIPKPDGITIENKIPENKNQDSKITGLFASRFFDFFKPSVVYVIMGFLYFLYL